MQEAGNPGPRQIAGALFYCAGAILFARITFSY